MREQGLVADHNSPKTVAFFADTEASVGAWTEFAGRLAHCGRQLYEKIVARASEQGLAEKSFWLLWTCRQSACGVSQSELARRIGASPACVSGLVERLATAGLIESSRPQRDRRQQLWSLRADGERLVERVAASLGPWASDLNAHFGPHRLAAVEHLLDQLQAPLASGEPTAGREPTSRILERQRGTAA